MKTIKEHLEKVAQAEFKRLAEDFSFPEDVEIKHKDRFYTYEKEGVRFAIDTFLGKFSVRAHIAGNCYPNDEEYEKIKKRFEKFKYQKQ